MTNAMGQARGVAMGTRGEELAERLMEGARRLAEFAGSMTEAEWQQAMPGDGRTMGVIVHHVASVYPVEVELAQEVAAGRRVEGVTMVEIDEMNARHGRENAGVGKAEALRLLESNSGAAAAAIRAMSEEALGRAVEVSLYADAPVSCQFVLEDHAVRHSYHHLKLMRRALGRV